MALAQQGDEREAHLRVLADDDALDVGDDLLAGFLDLGHCPRFLPGANGFVAPLPVWAR